MSELHDLLASEASRGGPVPAPPFETIVARSRQRRVTRILTVGGVVVVVAAAVVVPSIVGHRTTTVSADGVVDHGATTEVARKAITQQVAEQLVAGVSLPAGAVARSSAPTPILAEPMNSPGSENLIDVTRFYTVPGTIDSVLAYAKAHPPAGAYADGTSSSSDSNDVISQGIMFGAIATPDYAAPVVSVVATKLGAGIALRVDAFLVWRPLRTVAEDAPGDASSARACYGGGDCPLSLLDRSDAGELAAYFNSLDTQIPGDRYGCDGTAPPATFTFETAAGALIFAVSMCDGVTVTANGIAQPALDTTDVAMNPQLRSLLGLNSAPESSPAAALSALSAVSSATAAAPPASAGPQSPTH